MISGTWISWRFFYIILGKIFCRSVLVILVIVDSPFQDVVVMTHWWMQRWAFSEEQKRFFLYWWLECKRIGRNYSYLRLYFFRNHCSYDDLWQILAINVYHFIFQFKKFSTKFLTTKYLRWWDDGFSSQSWGSFEGRWYPGGGGGWRGCVVRRSAPGNPGASGGTSGPSWGEAGSGLAPDRWPVGHFRRLLLKAGCRSSGWPHSSKFPVRKG